MASRAEISGKKVHFDPKAVEEDISQRELLDRKAADERMKAIGGYGNSVIRSSNPYERASVGTGGSGGSVYQTKKPQARSITPPVEIPFSSTPNSLSKSGFTLGPPLRVPVKKDPENDKRLPDRARVGER